MSWSPSAPTPSKRHAATSSSCTVPIPNLRGLGAQIGLAAGLPLLGALAIAGVGIVGLRDVEHRVNLVVTQSKAKSDLVAEMRLGIVARADTVRNIALTDEIDAMKPDMQRIVALAARHEGLRKELEAIATSAEESTLLREAAAAEARALPLFKEAQAMAQLMQLEAAAKVLSGKLAPVQRDWLKALDGLAARSAAEAQQAAVEAHAASRRAGVLMLGTLALALAASVLSTLWIARRNRRRLAVAVQAAEAIAAGDLTVRVDAGGGDEVARVLASVGHMQERLRDTILRIREGVQSVASASSEIAAGNANLSARTEQQASSLQQTAASIEQMTGSVGHSAESARQAKELAGNASAVAQQGGRAVGDAVATMEEIRASSGRMADIIGVIDGIAFQTNILALNAAVEAASAGEQGRGFAVVASEVRSLAQRSAQAAKEIKALIDASVQKVATGSDLVGAAGTTMTDILSQVQRVDQLVNEISASATEQSSGIGQVNAAVSQIDHMTQQNAALVEQSAAAAESLRSLAEQLAQTVAVFRTEPALQPG